MCPTKNELRLLKFHTSVFNSGDGAATQRTRESVYVPHKERTAKLRFFNWVMSQSRGPVPVRNSTWAKPFSALRKMQPVRKWINPTKQLLEFDQQYHSGGLRVTSGCSHHNKDVGEEDRVEHKRCVLGDHLGSSYLCRLFPRAPCQWKGTDKVCSLYGGLNTHSRKSMEMENEKDERNGDGWTRRQRTRWFGDLAVCMKTCQLEVRQIYCNFTNARQLYLAFYRREREKSSHLAGWGIKCVSKRQYERVRVWICVCARCTCSYHMSDVSTSLFLR